MPDYAPLLAASLLGGLSFNPSQAIAAEPMATLQLQVCYQHGCARQSTVRLDRATLTQLDQLFGETTTDSAQERTAIAQAVALLEQFVGDRTGTDRDLGGTFPGAFQPGQMDCVDEATNTTRYLHLFMQQDWLRWHTPLEPVTRLPIPRGWWPHSSAVIRERASGQEFAVDSWFDANGQPPHIVDLPTWRRGWQPHGNQP